MGALLMDLTASSAFIILLTASAISSEQICIDKNKTVDTCQQQGVNISCPPGTVIYRPNIKAASEPCNKNPSCKENTVDLLVDTSDCYWKQRCKIRFPTTPLLKCFVEVESLYIRNWQCVNMTKSPQTYIGQICDSEIDLGSNIKQGIIRSHDNIPWLYGKDSFTKYIDTTLIARCTKTIYLKPVADERFLVSVDMMNIDEDNDHFSINGVNVSNNSYHSEFSAADRKIVFSFNSDPATTKGGSGFLICFKRLNDGERGANTMSACDGLISTANHANQPVDMITTTHDFCLKKKRISKLGGDDDPDEACKQMMSLYHISTQMPVSYTQLSTQAPVISDEFCIKCLKRQRLGKKCKKKCCKGKVVPTKCPKPKRKGCNLRGKRLDKLCKKCSNATRCKKKFIKRCNKCCRSQKDNLSKCKKKTNKRRKGKKRVKGKEKKRLSKKDKKKTNP